MSRGRSVGVSPALAVVGVRTAGRGSVVAGRWARRHDGGGGGMRGLRWRCRVRTLVHSGGPLAYLIELTTLASALPSSPDRPRTKSLDRPLRRNQRMWGPNNNGDAQHNQSRCCRQVVDRMRHRRCRYGVVRYGVRAASLVRTTVEPYGTTRNGMRQDGCLSCVKRV